MDMAAQEYVIFSIFFLSQDDSTALHMAAFEGHTSLCQFLLESGVDINEEDDVSQILIRSHYDYISIIGKDQLL